MFGSARLAAAILVRVGALFIFMAALILPAAAGVTITGATPSTFSGPGQTITFHFRVDQENAIINSVALTMNHPLGTVNCAPALPLAPFATTNCTATYVTQPSNNIDIIQYGMYDLTTNGGPRGGNVAGQVTVAYVPPGVPSLTSISPTSGPVTGGTSVTITGVNLNDVTGVTIGGTALIGTTVVNSTTITGTTPANTAGSRNVTVTTLSGSSTLTGGFTYISPTITVGPPSLPSATASNAYSQSVSATGGTAPYSFTVSAGALPPGVSLTSGGTLAGTPTTAGSFNFTVTATDANGFTGARAYALSVGAPTIMVAPSALPSDFAGVPYAQTFSASGGAAPYGYMVGAGALPPGLSLSASGDLSGTPTTAGTFNFTVTATDANGFPGTQAYALSIAAPTITLAPSALPGGTGGIAYTQALAASGGAAPYGYVVTAGALPPGLNLSATGDLTGTPTTAGTFNFTVTATDANGFTGAQAYAVSISAPAITLAPSTLTDGTAGMAYAEGLSATGGTAPYGFALTAGTLPTGLTLGADGSLTGTPTTAGSFNFTVTATDANGFTGVQAYALSIAAPTITLAPSTLPDGTGSIAYAQTFSASGGAAPYDYMVGAGALPPGLSLSASGDLSGTPTTAGTFNFTVTATDANGFPGTQVYALSIAAPTITLAPSTLPGGTGGIAYTQALAASGGAAPYGYVVTAGALPPGLNLSAAGDLSGTPTTAGTFNFTVTATDANGFTGVQVYALSIGAPTITLAPSTLPDGTGSTAYAQALSASGGVAPYAYTVTAGTLPPGLNLSAAGDLTGTPTTAGSFNFTVTATDANGFTGVQVYALSIGAPTITLAPSTLADGTGGIAYAQGLSATGGTAPYSFALTAGTLPTGLTLAADGSLAGTPTVAGNFNFTVTATDANGFTGVQVYALSIGAPTITLAPSTLPDGTGGIAYAQGLSATGGTAPYSFALTAGTLPTGLTLGADGSLAGTPTTAGNFNFTVTATDANGFTGVQAYALSIGAPAITLTPSSLPGGTGGVAYAQGLSATGGTAPYGFALTSGALPAGLTLAADGSLTGTPSESGSFAVTIEAADALGFTGSASYTLVIGAPVPVASSRTVEILAGTTGRASLTEGATGSPFTGAAIVSHPPAAAGTASIEGSGGNYDLVFAATETASGAVAITYTLSNAWGVSAPATITFSVTIRPDPSEDPEVIGLLTAQVDSARRLADAQIGNFNDRLERLHNESDRRAASIDLRIGLQREDEPLAYAGEEGGDARAFGFPLGGPGAPAGGSGGAASASRMAFWAGGFVNFGSREDGALELDQTLVGVSAGVDWRFSPKFVGGIGIGYGRDAVDVGDNGTESEAQAFSAALYGSYQPMAGIFLDGLLGFSRLEFDSHRFVTDTGGFAEGGRDGHQFFGSLSAGYEHRRDGLLLSPYARVEASWSRLDAFTETGAGPYNLAFGDQDAEMVAGVLGLRMEYHMPTDWGALVPRARLEYTHDFAGSSLASIGYADLSGGLPYALEIDPMSRDYLTLQAGFDAELGDDWQLGLDYRLNLGLDGDGHSHAVGLKVGANF
ncbi:putative Ig domain-containing protein [Mesorhizobium sp. M0938]|uniref:putative Ig domain-containing protein n=1 Tax=unclassified Mesorhizobium TaxID=325217 RepID=UPI00333D3D7C